MTLQPPAVMVPGQPYLLLLNFYNEQSGSLVDPDGGVQLDITFGEEVNLAADVAGPFTYSGASAPAGNTIYRISTGQYGFLWNPPVTLTAGVYVANWTCTYLGDQFLVFENFPSAGFVTPVPSGDYGLWTGSLSYQPAWSSSPFVIPLGSTDANGVSWLLQSVAGWDSPPSVGAVVQRSADHGGWPAAQFYGPRIITLKVVASAPSQALRDVARAALQQAVPVSDLATFTYNEPTPKVAYVRRNAGAAIVETYPTLTDVEFTIPLVAPDPRKYAVAAQQVQAVLNTGAATLALPFTGGLPATFPPTLPPGASAVTVANAGTFEARPQITITGPIINPTVQNLSLGQQITFTGLNMLATDTLVIDTDARQAYLNGVLYPADLSSAWWVLQPGETSVNLSGLADTGATLTVTWQSAWI